MNPVFIAADDRLRAAERELTVLAEVIDWFDRVEASSAVSTRAARIARTVSIANAIEAAYNGIETALDHLLRAIDGLVPQSGDSHAALLAQAANPNPGVRPALIAADTRLLLDRLRRFRHVVRHGYGSQLDLPPVLDNLETVRQALPCVRRDLDAFRQALGGGSASA